MEDDAERNAQLGERSRINIEDPAFEQLVLPDGHKNIVLSLISQHYRNRDSGRRSIDRSDIVKGKGERPSVHPFSNTLSFTDRVLCYRERSHFAPAWCSGGGKDKYGRSAPSHLWQNQRFWRC